MTILETIYGQLDVPAWNDDLILQALNAYGEWSYTEQKLFTQLLRKNDVLWDGGAFLGTFGIGVSQLAAAQGKELSCLLSIEPNPELHQCLKENLARNAPCKYQVVPSAVGRMAGMLQPIVGADDANINHGALAYRPCGDEVVGAVNCSTMLQLREFYGAYDALKLDLEGMEADAIRSDSEYLRRRKPVIWAECNEALSSVMLLEAMIELDYIPVFVAFPAFRSQNFKLNPNQMFPMAYEAALIAATKELLEGFDPSVVGEEVIMHVVLDERDLRRALWTTPRWSMPEWTDLSRPELVALLGRLAQQQELRHFLKENI